MSRRSLRSSTPAAILLFCIPAREHQPARADISESARRNGEGLKRLSSLPADDTDQGGHRRCWKDRAAKPTRHITDIVFVLAFLDTQQHKAQICGCQYVVGALEAHRWSGGRERLY